jgi:small basic protein (TIGR04137 family)
MSLDRSLKASGGMAQVRSVLTRAERIAKAVEDRKIDPKKPKALGIAKTRVGKA